MKIVYLVVVGLALSPGVSAQVVHKELGESGKHIAVRGAAMVNSLQNQKRKVNILLDSADHTGSRFDVNHPDHKLAISLIDKAITLCVTHNLSGEHYQASMMKLDLFYLTGRINEMELM